MAFFYRDQENVSPLISEERNGKMQSRVEIIVGPEFQSKGDYILPASREPCPMLVTALAVLGGAA